MMLHCVLGKGGVIVGKVFMGGRMVYPVMVVEDGAESFIYFNTKKEAIKYIQKEE